MWKKNPVNINKHILCILLDINIGNLIFNKMYKIIFNINIKHFYK